MNIRTGLVRSAFLLLLGIALVAPTAKSFGQLIAQESLLAKHNNELVSYTIEHWMIVPFETVIIDQDLRVEAWMTIPFGADQETEVEDWMASTWF